MEIWVGIDISKDTINAAWETENEKFHECFPNTMTGFNQLLEKSPSDAKFVIESTGTYHMNCAMFLTACERHVSVENPLTVQRHIQSDPKHCESDKSDSFSIAKYGRETRPEPWSAPSKEASKARHYKTLIDAFQEVITMSTSLLHELSQEGIEDDAIKICMDVIKQHKKNLSKAERAFEEIVCKH